MMEEINALDEQLKGVLESQRRAIQEKEKLIQDGKKELKGLKKRLRETERGYLLMTGRTKKSEKQKDAKPAVKQPARLAPNKNGN